MGGLSNTEVTVIEVRTWLCAQLQARATARQSTVGLWEDTRKYRASALVEGAEGVR